jgi:transposase InsO family protein
MIAFIDAHREEYVVEPIRALLPIAPSSYHEHKASERAPERLPPRVRRDGELRVEIQRVWEESVQVYGVRKVWRQLRREGFAVARCTVAWLMGELGLRGAARCEGGGSRPRTRPLALSAQRIASTGCSWRASRMRCGSRT